MFILEKCRMVLKCHRHEVTYVNAAKVFYKNVQHQMSANG